MNLKLKLGEDLKVYRIYDTKLNKYWHTDNGKTGWIKPGHAKASWKQGADISLFPPHEDKYKRRISFNSQTRFVIHEFKLTKV